MGMVPSPRYSCSLELWSWLVSLGACEFWEFLDAIKSVLKTSLLWMNHHELVNFWGFDLVIGSHTCVIIGSFMEVVVFAPPILLNGDDDFAMPDVTAV